MFEHHPEDPRLIDKECKAKRYFVHPFTHSPMLEKYPGAELCKAPIVGSSSARLPCCEEEKHAKQLNKPPPWP